MWLLHLLERVGARAYRSGVGIGADFDALAGEANRIDAVADSLDDRIDMARTRVTDLLETGWTGESSGSFRAAFEQWEAHGRRNVATLRRLVEGLRGALADMVSHEEAVTEETLSLSARLPVIDVAARLGEHR